MPSVVIDGFVFEHKGQRGIWRLFYETIRRFPPEAGVALWLRAPAALPHPANCRVLQDNARWLFPRWQFWPRVRRAIDRRRLPAQVQTAHIFHASFNTLPPSGRWKYVLTIYDMIPERFQTTCSGWAETHIRAKQLAIQRADRVITISQATADDLTALYPDVRSRIRVIPCGGDHLVATPLTTRPVLEPYVLFVGNRGQYKNYQIVIQAMSLSTWPRDIGLRVVGDGFTPQEQDVLRMGRLMDRVLNLGRVSEGVLREQYRQATAFIYPSLCEGFGLPVLEAQSNTCPVVLSDIPAFREIAGTSAIFFDPNSPLTLAEAVAAVREPVRRAELVEAGLANVHRFSWDRAAEQTLSVYQELMEASPK